MISSRTMRLLNSHLNNLIARRDTILEDRSYPFGGGTPESITQEIEELRSDIDVLVELQESELWVSTLRTDDPALHNKAVEKLTRELGDSAVKVCTQVVTTGRHSQASSERTIYEVLVRYNKLSKTNARGKGGEA